MLFRSYVNLTRDTNNNDKIRKEVISIKKNHNGKYPPINIITGSQGTSTCIFCGNVMKGDEIRNQARLGKMDVCLIAKMINKKNSERIRIFKIPNDNDEQVIILLENTIKNFDKKYLIHEPLPEYSGRGIQVQVSVPRQYGITQFSQFFTSRQLFVITKMMEWIDKTKNEMKKKELDPELINAISLYLSLGINKLAENSSRFTGWHAKAKVTRDITAHNSYVLNWDFVEVYPFGGGTGSFTAYLNKIGRAHV